MDFPQLLGATYSSFSAKADCQRSMNCFLGRIESGAGRGPFALYKQNGLRPLTSYGQRCRGFLELNDHLFDVQDDRILDRVSELTVSQNYGPIQNTENFVSMAASANSLFVVTGGTL